MLSKEARQTRAEYMKKWRKENPEKVKKQREIYWERKAKEAMQNGNK